MKFTRAALELAYAEKFGLGKVTPPPEKLIIEPLPALTILGNTALEIKVGAIKFT
jgi:hypothetical protein